MDHQIRSARLAGLPRLLLSSLFLAACAAPTAPAPQVVTQEVQVTVQTVVTQEVPVEVMVTPTPEPTVAPKSGGTLIAARAADMTGLDPHKQTAFSSFRVLEHIYEPLLNLDKNMNVVPNLAKSWEWSADGLTLTMTLQDGVVFHNGTAMTSADVKATYERILNEETAAAARSFFSSIASVEAPDPATVVFTLSTPNAALLAAMTNPNSGIMSKALLDSGWDPASEAIGTGPFKLASWEPDNVLVLERNPDYWRAGQPYLDKIEFRTIPDESSILAGLRAGTIDWALINDPRVGLVAASGGSELVKDTAPALAYHVLQLNAKRPMFEDQLVRQAISCAIDRQQVLDTASLGEGQVTSPATPLFYRADLGSLFCYQKDIAKAQSLMAQAGNPEVKFTVIVATGEPPTAVAEAQNIQAQLAEIGVTMDIETLELGVYVDRWLKGDFDAAVALNGGNPDPHNMFFRYWHSTGNLNGVANYSSAEIDALLDKAVAMTDPAERKAVYDQVQQKLAEAAPWVWLYVGYEYRIYQPYVENFTNMSNGQTIYLRETWLNK